MPKDLARTRTYGNSAWNRRKARLRLRGVSLCMPRHVCRCAFVRVKRTLNCIKIERLWRMWSSEPAKNSAQAKEACRLSAEAFLRDGFPHSPLFVCYLRILCFWYSLRYANERTNERTNERNYGARGGFVKYLRLSRRNLCYFVLRKRGMIVERNTVCAAVLFHGYYYNLLSGRFQPLGEVFNW